VPAVSGSGDCDLASLGALGVPAGRRYSRAAVLSVLQQRQHDPIEASWITKDDQVLEIAAGN